MRIRIKPPRIIVHYAKNDRYIPKKLYCELKERKKCKICGCLRQKKKPLEIHHKVPISEGGKSDYKNLIAVCETCHKELHKRK